MSQILTKLGLDRVRVRELLGEPRAANTVSTHRNANNYWYGPDQLRIRDRLRHHTDWIVAQFVVLGRKPRHIAALMGVSEESVRRRLRARKLFNSHGKPGRPYPKKARSR